MAAAASRRAFNQLKKLEQVNKMDDIRQLRVVGYARVSSDEQADHGSGLEYQVEAVEKFAQSQNYNLVTIIQDVVSGATLPANREGFTQVLDMAKGQQFDLLLVWKFDRLARHLVYAVQTVAELQDLGVALRSVTEPIDTASPMGQMIFSVLAGMASMEREAIKERTRAGRVKKAERGGYACGNVPLGYRRTEQGLEPDEEEANTVRLIFQLREQGNSLREIAKQLTKEGYQTKKGGNWYASTVAAVLDNAKYSGRVEYVFGTIGKHVVCEGEHEPIIER